MNPAPVRVLVPSLVVLLLAFGAGCSSGDSADSGGAVSTTSEGSADDAAARARQQGASAGQPEQVVDSRSVVYRGTVALGSPDVGRSQREVQQVVDRYGGRVTEEKTTTDEDGEPAYTRMVLRIPSEDFAEAMAALKGVAELESADASEDDVTSKVIDTRARLTVQRRSIERITTLLARAQSIRDIIAIESELARRQAALESLERQAAYLADQTAFSTITVSIDKLTEQARPRDDDDTGFLAGLSAGWRSLTLFALAVATVAGALLPWLALAGLLGVPLLLVLRSVRRRRAASPGGDSATVEG